MAGVGVEELASALTWLRAPFLRLLPTHPASPRARGANGAPVVVGNALVRSHQSIVGGCERFLTGAGMTMSSARIYRISLTTWGMDASR